MNSTGAKDKVAVSLLDLALPVASVNSAPPLLENAPTLDVVLEVAQLILDLITADSSTPMSTMTAKTPAVKTMLDYPLLNLTAELLIASASKVLWVVLVLLLSASNIPAVLTTAN